MNVRIAPDEPNLRTVLYHGVVRIRITSDAVIIYKKDEHRPMVFAFDTIKTIDIDTLGAWP